MTEQQAIKTLKHIRESGAGKAALTKSAYEALGIAINALSRPAGRDAISRQAATSAICNACGKIDCDKTNECEKLQLQSMQPEQLEQCPVYGGLCCYPSNQCYDCPRHAARPGWRPVVVELTEDGSRMVDADKLKKHISKKNAETRAFGSVGELLINSWIDEMVDSGVKRRTE